MSQRSTHRECSSISSWESTSDAALPTIFHQGLNTGQVAMPVTAGGGAGLSLGGLMPPPLLTPGFSQTPSSPSLSSVTTKKYSTSSVTHSNGPKMVTTVTETHTTKAPEMPAPVTTVQTYETCTIPAVTSVRDAVRSPFVPLGSSSLPAVGMLQPITDVHQAAVIPVTVGGMHAETGGDDGARNSRGTMKYITDGHQTHLIEKSVVGDEKFKASIHPLSGQMSHGEAVLSPRGVGLGFGALAASGAVCSGGYQTSHSQSSSSYQCSSSSTTSYRSTDGSHIFCGTSAPLPAVTGGHIVGSSSVSVPSITGGHTLGTSVPVPAVTGGHILGSSVPVPAITGGHILGSSVPVPAITGGHILGSSVPVPAITGGHILGSSVPVPAITGGHILGSSVPVPAITGGHILGSSVPVPGIAVANDGLPLHSQYHQTPGWTLMSEEVTMQPPHHDTTGGIHTTASRVEGANV